MAYDISRYEFPSLDIMFCAVADYSRSHGDITFQTGDDIGSLLFLIPTDRSVEKQNSNDDTKINPILETGGKEDSEFHD
jgi:hypothetical protein